LIHQFTAAVKSSTLDSTAKAMSALETVFTKDAKLTPILQAPTLSSSDKSAIIAELTKHLGPGADKDKTLKFFFQTLAENNRLGLLEGISQKFSQLIAAHQGEVELLVVSAAVSLFEFNQILLLSYFGMEWEKRRKMDRQLLSTTNANTCLSL
jgi:F-type H+-transporting ATPase subunit O